MRTNVLMALYALVVLLLTATLLPLLPVGTWVVRILDFPRLQIAGLIVLTIAGLVACRPERGAVLATLLPIGVLIAAFVWQLSHVAPFSPLWAREVPDSADRSATEADVSVTIVNLQYSNPSKDAVRQQLERIDGDLVLLIEIDQAWRDGLQGLFDLYPHQEGVVREEGLGLMLLSKLPVIDAEVRHLISEERASIFAEIKARDGRPFRFVGVHPTPPGLEVEGDEGRHDSRIRDAELMLVAKEVARLPDERWVVTGDFNDVAWSHTTRLFKRMSGLKDPRVGRGLYNTYHAGYPGWRFPIDQVFVSPSAEVVSLDSFRPEGSDHFAITAGFVFQGAEAIDPEPEGNDPEDAEEMIEEGKEDAREDEAP